MPETVIALIAAMPEETRPLLRRVGSYRTERLATFPLYRFTIAGRTCCLIESGMGPEHAAAAAGALLALVSPCLLLNFGFGGAVSAGPGIGDVVVAERVFCYVNGQFTEEPGLSRLPTDAIPTLPENDCRVKPFALLRGTFITTSEIVTKSVMAARLPAITGHPVLEMETAAVARAAATAGIPLIAVRAISDDAHEELGFAITDFTDGQMNLRLSRVLLAVARNPRLIPQLLRLSHNTGIAGRNLAATVEAVISGLDGGTP